MDNLGTKETKALDGLFYEVGSYRNGRDLNELYDFIIKFPKIAPFNALLLHIQKPGSRYVASAIEWKTKFGRSVKPGARPLVILWPFAPVHFVFELGDTEGPEPFPEKLLKPFKSDGKLPPGRMKKLLSNLPRSGVSYHEIDHGSESAGFIRTDTGNRVLSYGEKKLNVFYNMVVNINHTPEEKFATIAHELGHLFCGHLGTINDKWWPDRRKLDVCIQEFEAESVSWLVCERIGIKSPAAGYLNGYLNSGSEIPPISLDTVIKAAGMVEVMTMKAMPVRKELVSEARYGDE